MQFKHLFILILICFQSSAQISVSKVSSKNLTADTFIGVDQFENLFYIYNNILYKNNNSKSFGSFQLGDLTSVDISNPLKIVLFYRDFNTAVLVDNNLNETDRIVFQNNISFIRKASKDKLWIINADTNQLEVFNFKNKNTEFQSMPVKEKIIDIQSNFNDVILRSNDAIYEYDYLCNMTGTQTFENTKKMKLFKNKRISLTKNQLYFFDKNNRETFIFQAKEIVDFYFRNDDFYIFDGTVIDSYRIDKKQ